MNLIKLRVASLEDYKKGSLHGLEALNFGTVPKWTTNFFTEKIKLQSHAHHFGRQHNKNAGGIKISVKISVPPGFFNFYKRVKGFYYNNIKVQFILPIILLC